MPDSAVSGNGTPFLSGQPGPAPSPKMKISLVLFCLTAATVSAADSVVVFNEINYNPKAGQPEFIEIRNLQGVDVNIAGWSITGGASFTFPPNTVIPGRGYMAIG